MFFVYVFVIVYLEICLMKHFINLKVNKKSLINLFFSIVFLIALGLIIFIVPPSQQFHFVSITISVLYIFLVLLYFFMFFLSMVLLKSVKHALSISLFTITALFFLLYKLTHPLFFIMLAALFIVAELLFTAKK